MTNSINSHLNSITMGILLGFLFLAFIANVILRFLPKDQLEIIDHLKSKFGSKSITNILAILIFGVFIVNESLMYARPGHQYFIVSPFGQKTAIFESGYHMIVPLSRVQEWEKFVDVKAVALDKDGNYIESIEGIEGIIPGGIGIRFIDQVTGVLKISARFQLPQDGPSFIQVAEEFRHPQNLVNNTLLPTVKEQAYNVAYMYTAENYVSGAASDFRLTLDEALKNGGFKVVRKEYSDTIYESFTGLESAISKDRTVKEIKTRYEIRKVLKDGVPVRIPHDITKNHILVSQVIVDDIRLEAKFRKKLEEQRDISAQKRIELQKIETAKAAQQRILAEGERDKAAERVSQEKNQVSKLIAIETSVKEEESKRQLAEIALKTERLDAERRKVAADAKRYELAQADGLSEEVKYKIDADVRIAEAAARAIENAKWPTTVVTGGGDKGNTGLLEQLIGAELAKGMLPATKKQ